MDMLDDMDLDGSDDLNGLCRAWHTWLEDNV